MARGADIRATLDRRTVNEGGSMAGGEVQIVGLCKRFDDVEAVAGIDLDVASGEFFSILGPSGCGKTTTLRLVAGFEQPTSGSIYLDGVDVADKPPHKRNVNTVFQSYALFPFLSVADNVAFGLRYQRLTKAESSPSDRCRARAGAAARLREASAGTTVRRTAAAGGPGPGPGSQPCGAPARRTARRAGRQTQTHPSDRAKGAAGDRGHHLSLCDPRPGRGAHHVGPPRCDGIRQGRPGGRAGRGL